jgi:hypothetical protein
MPFTLPICSPQKGIWGKIVNEHILPIIFYGDQVPLS